MHLLHLSNEDLATEHKRPANTGAGTVIGANSAAWQSGSEAREERSATEVTNIIDAATIERCRLEKPGYPLRDLIGSGHDT
jgi:hypothetical protein